MRQSGGSPETVMRQSTALLQLQALQTCLFLSVQLDDQSASDVPTGWTHGHGLQPTAKAMAKTYNIHCGQNGCSNYS